ncbi:glycosyltransferase family 4 protein [Aestuariivita boseongensis]|uniref:glycosyltransferase family 4 protein n=1 Tax=Aestuariivita boseongensis TaxID=1470562 RepID=UPI00068196EB|nr:glycosyltransferase family 4 protein [Aestuariivita boseongensis]
MRPIAFYAPLKSPRHPTASGDRQIARNLMAALAQGFERPVTLASELRSFEPKGNADTQRQLMAEAQSEATRVLRDLPDPAIWVTYHNYYKAPDLIGPVVSKRVGIPYVQIEATRAKSRLTGPWADFAEMAHLASDAADVIFHFTGNDRIALERDRCADQQIVELPPFLDRDTMPAASDHSGPMLAVGMMRQGDKLASYRLIAETLSHLRRPDWRLDIAGDGEARVEVQALFAPFGNRVRFLGALSREDLAQAYAKASLLLWPGVNEAFGMAYLEAQAAGLPVVAQDRPGVRDVLVPGVYPTPEEGPAALAKRVDHLLADPELSRKFSEEARAYVQARHLRPAAIGILRNTLGPLMEGTE